MLHYETILPDTLELLKRIQASNLFKNTRLAGGTALALHLGHRQSVDLDLFGAIDATLEEIVDELSEFADVSPISSSKMMRFLIADGVKVDIVNYHYPWIDNPVIEDGIVLAGIKDISAMKLSAITNRGTRKDFIDFYTLRKRYSFDELIRFYLEKYTDAQLFTTIKSLTYFNDAQQDPFPVMLEPLDWEALKMSIVADVNGFSAP